MKLVTILIAALAPTVASAITPADVSVKCISASGAVLYQRGSCPPGSKIEVVRHDALPDAPNTRWTFARSVDYMTNVATCTARSPAFPIPAKRENVYAHLIVIASKSGEPTVSVLNTSSSAIFHHNIHGTGIKVGDDDLVPFAARPTQTVLVAASGASSSVVNSLQHSKTARIRVRIWPWDEPYDSVGIPLQTFGQAYSLAKECAKSL